MSMTKENKMGTQPMLRLIVSMSLPAMFSMLVQSLYNIVDSMFVARLGEEALTAVSLAFPVQTLLIAVAVGTGVGINSLVARRLGEGRREEADHAATHGVLLALASWLVFAILGLCATRAFFQAFSDNPQVVDMGCQYLYVVTIASLGVFMEINLEKTLQATGNMIYPMVFQLIGAVANIILDPILIFGLLGMPRMGVLGAAVATVIGQLLAMAYSLYITLRKEHEVKISFQHFRLRGRTIRDIYAVGLPSIVMQAIGSVLNMGLNAILIAFSEAAVSVMGVYYKLQSFVFMPVFGLTQGVMPIMGFNFGARNKARMLSALRYGCFIALGIMAAGTLLFLLLPRQLLMMFNASAQMLEIGIPALRIISICFIPAALGILFSTTFQAVGKGNYSLIISLLRQLIVILPVAYLMSRMGLVYFWYAFPIAEGVSLLASIGLYGRLYRTHIRDLRPAEGAMATDSEASV